MPQARPLVKTYLPPLQRIFGTQAVPVLDGLLIIAAGIALFAVIGMEEQIRLAHKRMRSSNNFP